MSLGFGRKDRIRWDWAMSPTRSAEADWRTEAEFHEARIYSFASEAIIHSKTKREELSRIIWMSTLHFLRLDEEETR
jgi:hypothetical protein